jgi:hypothetical protein
MFSTRSLLFALVATAAVSLATKPALADASVKVPFSFTVDGKKCPAGRYLVKGDATSNTVTLVGRDSSRIFSWIVIPNTAQGNSQSVVLRFEGAGPEHVLRSIQYGSQATARIQNRTLSGDDADNTAHGGR